MPPLPGDRFNARGQFAVLSFQLLQFSFGVEPINVQHENAGQAAGSDANIVLWVALPPLLDYAGVGGGVFEPVRTCRPLVAGLAWEYAQSAFSELAVPSGSIDGPQNGISSSRSSAGSDPASDLGSTAGFRAGDAANFMDFCGTSRMRMHSTVFPAIGVVVG